MALANCINVMQRFQRTTISLPKGLPNRARNAGLNISGIAAKAVLKEVKKIESETGGGRQAHSPAAISMSGGATCH